VLRATAFTLGAFAAAAIAHADAPLPGPAAEATPVPPPPAPPPAGARLVGLKRVAVVGVADGPKSLEFLPDGKRVWTNNLYGNKTQLIDAATMQVLRTNTWDGEPVEVGFTHGGQRAWISLYENETVLVVDTDTGALLARIKVGVIPKVIAPSPDGKWVYVANWGHVPPKKGEKFTVSVLDAEAMTRVKDIPVVRIPRGMAFTPDGKYAYIANMGESRLTKVDVAAGHTVVGHFEVGPGPRHVVGDRAGKFLYVSLNKGNRIVKYAVAEDRAVAAAEVGVQPRTIDLSPDERYLYVCNYQDDALGVVDTETMRQIFTVPTDHHPIGVAASPEGRRVWVANYSTRPSTLWVYDAVFEGEAQVPAPE
jgi:YVTN family beta-propeller protein